MAIAIVDSGEVVVCRVINGDTCLHLACWRGDMNMAMALIDMGADVNARNDKQMTPLHKACMESHMELAMSLVDRGADVEARENTIENWLFNEYQKTPLDYLSMENRNRLESMINRNVGNVMSSMIQRTQEKDSARRISELPEEIGRKVASYLGGKRKTKKRKTRRRKTRKH